MQLISARAVGKPTVNRSDRGSGCREKLAGHAYSLLTFLFRLEEAGQIVAY